MMTTRKPEKKAKGKSFLLRIFIITALTVYSFVVLAGMQSELAQKNQELEDIRGRVERQRILNKELEGVLTHGMGDEFVERYARDQLDYVAPDEIVFIDISGS